MRRDLARTLEGKLMRRHLGLRWTDSFLEEVWTSKVTDGRESQNFWEIKDTRFFNLLFSHNSHNLFYGRRRYVLL